ncbi:uncharacterized protein LOC112680971 [Sipha flava]|uniref:Uncharacterized protein LOC112680971 n=1 Tax=Sipha flava TaxID=143950 RepID=A0A8B8F855_9HEMI|nr:uncharacterized protein LOC112680971 [Sipha flava]
MIFKKTFLVLVFTVYCYMSSIKGADDKEAGDRELIAKLLTVVLRCFKDANWTACSEMIKTKYDPTQTKYKQCTCQLACAGEELEMINSKGEPVPSKFLDYTNRINSPTIKKEMQTIYDKCNTVKGTDKCDLSEKFAICALKESPAIKDRIIMLTDTLMKIKQK